MNLEMYQKEVLQNYKRSSQITRVLTEDWFNREMYCPCCLNEKVKNFPNNQKGSDFFCEKCKSKTIHRKLKSLGISKDTKIRAGLSQKLAKKIKEVLFFEEALFLRKTRKVRPTLPYKKI